MPTSRRPLCIHRPAVCTIRLLKSTTPIEINETGAAIFVDGEFEAVYEGGRYTYEGAPGVHVIEVKKKYFETARRKVKVLSGDISDPVRFTLVRATRMGRVEKLDVRAAQATGALLVSTVPRDGTQITVRFGSDVQTEYAPIRLSPTPAGVYRVELRYQEMVGDTTVEVLRNRKTRLDWDWEKRSAEKRRRELEEEESKHGAIRVVGDTLTYKLRGPASADLTVGQFARVPVGTYSLLAQDDTYDDRVDALEVRPRTTTDVTWHPKYRLPSEPIPAVYPALLPERDTVQHPTSAERRPAYGRHGRFVDPLRAVSYSCLLGGAGFSLLATVAFASQGELDELGGLCPWVLPIIGVGVAVFIPYQVSKHRYRRALSRLRHDREVLRDLDAVLGNQRRLTEYERDKMEAEQFSAERERVSRLNGARGRHKVEYSELRD